MALARVPKIPPFEVGFAICQLQGGRLVPGPVRTGTRTSVTFPVSCPPGGTPIGTFHTHPGGVAQPSGQDIRAARQAKLKNVCVMNDKTMNCFRVR